MQILRPLLLFVWLLLLHCFFKQNISASPTSQPADNFIEDIIKIDIPGLEGAYNPSIIDFKDGYLMAFRYDTYKLPIGLHLHDFCQHIGIILLDANFKIKGPWQPCIGNRCYDPRLLKIDDTIYLIFASPDHSEPHSCLSSRLNLCTITYSENGISVANLNALSAPCQQKWEKNWVLFNYDSKIFLEYSISPHIILEPSLIDGLCIQHTFTGENNCNTIEWPYGIIRGGTPALLVDGKYLGFFHSSEINKKTKRYIYYAGAYTFSNAPPFTLNQISRTPFSHPDFYSTPKNPKTESQVIYPGGFVIKNGKIYLCYGENDDAIKIMVLDQKKLFESLQNLCK